MIGTHRVGTHLHPSALLTVSRDNDTVLRFNYYCIPTLFRVLFTNIQTRS